MKTKFKFFICLSLVLVAFSACEKDKDPPTPAIETETGLYTNPLLKRELVWDPTVVFDGTTYYMYSTEENWNWSPEADGGDGWPEGTRPEMGIFTSTDMITWEHVGAVQEKNDALWHRGLDAFILNDKFYVYATSDVSGVGNIYVYESSKGDSGFALKGMVKFPTSLKITPDSYASFIVDGAKQYITIDGTVGEVKGVYLVEMDGTMTFKAGTEPKLISDWTHDPHGFTLQNSTIFKKDATYYLFAKNSNYGTGTGVLKVLKSSAITGPYKDSKGGNDGNTVIASAENDKQANGSSILKDADGDYWIYYNVGGGWTAKLFLDKLLWDTDGFPYVKDNKPSGTEQVGPAIVKK